MLVLAICCYLTSGVLLYQQNKKARLTIVIAFVLATALIAHAFSLANIVNGEYINFSFINSSVMTLWWIAIVFAFLLIKNPLQLPAGLLYIAIAVFLIINALFPNTQVKPIGFDLALHVFLSITAYGFLFLAFFQSFIISLQDKQLKDKKSFISMQLPSLEHMEKLLFQLLGIGVILLTLSLLSGFVFLENLFAQHLVHKTVLSILAWLLLVTIFLGHYVFGWRNRQTNLIIKIGFTLLLLGYSGSKFVLEYLLSS